MKLSTNIETATFACPVFLFSVLLSLVVGSPICPSQKLLFNGDCCLECPPGKGILLPCDQENNTVCESCMPGQTFSAHSSHEDGCNMCSQCLSNERVKHPCNTTHDTTCECKGDFFRNNEDHSCSQCDLCPKGYGANISCSSDRNSKCVKCVNATFSDTISAVDGCKKCRICPTGSKTLSKCTVLHDTVCEAFVPQVTVAIQSDGTTQFHYLVRQQSANIVPLYCAILGGVVLGLVGYVLFKKWSFYKVKLQQQKPHRLNDVDSRGLTKEQVNMQSKSSITPYASNLQNHKLVGSMPSIHVPLMAMPVGMKYADLSSEKKKEVEKLLGTTRLDRRDWRGLALEVGFTEEDTVSLIKNSHKHLPAEKMLMIWSRREDATLGLLVAALHRIGRTDVLNVIPVYISLSQIT